MELANALMTPKDERKAVTVQYKIYWIHRHEWNAQWIAQYHAAVPALAKELSTGFTGMNGMLSG